MCTTAVYIKRFSIICKHESVGVQQFRLIYFTIILELGVTVTIPESPLDEPDGLRHQKLLIEASADIQAAVTTAPVVDKRHLKEHSRTRVSEVIKLDFDLSHPVYRKLKLHILRWVLGCMEQCDLLVRLKAVPSTSGSGSSPTPYVLMEGDIPSGEELICEMWYTSRDNVNLLLEICRQGMMASQSDGKFSAVDMRSVILLYKSWVQVCGCSTEFTCSMEY